MKSAILTILLFGLHATTSSYCCPGEIEFWFGKRNKIPYRWQICDGSNGTPDMRDRFPVGAGKLFPFGARGGNENYGDITLTVKELPAHYHALKDVTVSEDGDHSHGANGKIGMNGDHDHDSGYLDTEAVDDHTHDFSTATDKGGHPHKFDLNTNQMGDHNHKVNVYVMEEGLHSHMFELGASKGAHGHPVAVYLDNNGDHKHGVTASGSFSIPDHVHGVGEYGFDKHKFKHYHDVTGTTSADGAHYHAVNLPTSDDGDHNHNFQGQTDTKGEHQHDAGTLATLNAGDHYHGVEKQAVSENGDHTHDVLGFFEVDYDTKEDEEQFDLSFDRIDREQPGYPKPTDKVGNHKHYVPEQMTKKAGLHDHEIDGKVAVNGEHYHMVDGDLTDNGNHKHNVYGDSEAVDNHYHKVDGKTDEVVVTLDHEIENYSGKAGAEDIDLEVEGNTDLKGMHSHEANAKIDDNTGNHYHDVYGDIKEAGLHKHEANADSMNNGDHYHNVMGSVGDDEDGEHYHQIAGVTKPNGAHKHKVVGKTAKNGDHDHGIKIYVEADGLHSHEVDGTTTEKGKNEPFNVLPPFRAVDMICCVDYSSSSSSSSSSDSSRKYMDDEYDDDKNDYNGNDYNQNDYDNKNDYGLYPNDDDMKYPENDYPDNDMKYQDNEYKEPADPYKNFAKY